MFPNLRIDTNLVLIPVTVTTPLNQFVTGMEKENFRLMEDKVEQEVSYFASFDAPLSIGLVFDISGSMGNKLNKSRQAAAEFFKTANPQDEFFLVQFNDRPQLINSFTRSTEEIQNRLTFTQAKGRTALLDGIYRRSGAEEGQNPRQALLIISDGGDNSSRYTETEVRNLLREADAQTVRDGHLRADGLARPQRGRTGRSRRCSANSLEMTGGRHFPVDNLNDLPDIAAKIGIELRNQYVLGYVSKNQTRDGKYRRVTVKLNQPRGLPPLRALYRQGYYAPTQ